MSRLDRIGFLGRSHAHGDSEAPEGFDGLSRSRAEFLSTVPIFLGLSETMRDKIAMRSTWVQLAAGDWLFRQGDTADSLYVVRSGRLEILIEDPDPIVVRVLSHGSPVGELSLLTQSKRSAAARARRDSELLRLERSEFTKLLVEEPEFALALTRLLGRQLQLSRGLMTGDQPLPKTVAVVPAAGASAAGFSDALVEALGRWENVARLENDDEQFDPYASGGRLDQSEQHHDKVLLIVEPLPRSDIWTDFCLRQADRVFVVGRGDVPDELSMGDSAKECDLVLYEPPDAPTIERWCDAVGPRAVYLVSDSLGAADTIDGIARRLTGRSVGIALSGGGARGFAHIGVFDELLESGIVVDRVSGCSMGAFIGGMFAMGMTTDEIRARCRSEFIERNPLGDYTLPFVSLVRGKRAKAMLERTFGSITIEELPREYCCVSCDLVTGHLIVHRRGLLSAAVGASMCLPGVVAPVQRDGRMLVDGGVLNNLPVEPLAATGEGPVIAVDVTASFLSPEAVMGGRIRTSSKRWAARARELMLGQDAPQPSFVEVMTRAIGIGSIETVEAARDRADFLIVPETGTVGLLAFDQLDRMIDIGHRAAQAALERMPMSLEYD